MDPALYATGRNKGLILYYVFIILYFYSNLKFWTATT